MMAKKYVKPELLFESFELSQQIAACAFDSGNTLGDISSCKFTGNNPATGEQISIFLEVSTMCTTKAESYCYHNGTGGYYSIFNS